MIQAGYKGSGINEVIWMGDVVNDSAKLRHRGKLERLSGKKGARLRAEAVASQKIVAGD